MSAAIWSTPEKLMLDYPVVSFLQFFDNHRLMHTVRPMWRTVKGGSRSYVKHLLSDLAGSLRSSANIQNVKRDHFDTLIYVLLFADCIKVFSAETAEIKSGIMPGWSDKHGRYDAVGKSGQFMIKKGTIGYHLDNRLLETISYEEAAEIYAKLG
jgi:hypothetical protein